MSIPTDITLLVDFLAELFFQKFVQALTKNAASKPPILLNEVRQPGTNTFSSSHSRVLASWRLFFSCLTLVSTFSPAFNQRMSCCLSGSIPAPSAILLSDLYARRTSQITYLLKHILPEGVSLASPATASAASSWALHPSSSWDSWVFFSIRSCTINDP